MKEIRFLIKALIPVLVSVSVNNTRFFDAEVAQQHIEKHLFPYVSTTTKTSGKDTSEGLFFFYCFPLYSSFFLPLFSRGERYE